MSRTDWTRISLTGLNYFYTALSNFLEKKIVCWILISSIISQQVIDAYSILYTDSLSNPHLPKILILADEATHYILAISF